MGQSNMVGRDTRGMDASVADLRVLTFNTNGDWVVARDPIHPQVGGIACGVGPGISFALEMLKADTNNLIGLVPCAVGGTPLRRWVKGGDLYENALSRAKMAAKTGVISGVLWHQGEAETSKLENAETYEMRLTNMFKDLRADLGMPDLPFVVGQLGDFLALTPDKYPHAETVRAAIKHIPAALSQTGYADAGGLEHKGDKLHFSAAAQRELGRRYAQAMLELQKPATATSVVNIWPEGKMPGKGASEPETEKPSKDAYHRITNVSRPTLSFFPAAKQGASVPTMIICPGGGYGYVVMDKEGTEIAAWLNTNGFNALVLKYRTPNNRAGALQDVQRAISLARARAAEWNIDPKRLGIIGFSAGGNLAAKASTLFDTRAYSALDETDEQSCRPDFAVLVYPAYLDDKNGHVATNLNLQANIPPTLIVHSEDDKTFVPGSKLYNAALDGLATPHAFLLYRTGGHGYGLHCEHDAKAWPMDAIEWLERIGVKPWINGKK